MTTTTMTTTQVGIPSCRDLSSLSLSLLHERLHSGNATVWDRMRSIVAYACTYLWAISLILLIVVIYASIRGPLNILNSFNTGKVKPRFVLT